MKQPHIPSKMDRHSFENGSICGLKRTYMPSKTDIRPVENRYTSVSDAAGIRLPADGRKRGDGHVRLFITFATQTNHE